MAGMLWFLVDRNIVYEGPPVHASAEEQPLPRTKPSDDGFKPIDAIPRLDIPTIEVSAAIEEAGLTGGGGMAEPTTPQIVARYKYGAFPGEGSNTILAGHVDADYGASSGVFRRLPDLRQGDKITFVTKNEPIHYRVTTMNSYRLDNAPLREIFKSTDHDRLTLITCGGTWNSERETYEERLIVVVERID